MRCAVLGSPIEHSLSPTLHRAAYAELGLDWTYDAIEVDSAGLPEFVGSLGPEWRGLSLTMPLKRTVLPLLDHLDSWASRSGAANTVLFDEDGLRGLNTDVPGAASAILERTSQPLSRAVVLGGGATATSTLLALGNLGVAEATLLVRSPERAQETVDQVGSAVAVTVGLLDGPVPPADIVVSTIPASAQAPSLVDALSDVPVVFDVVYDPWPTPLAASAEGRVLVTGLDLLVHQAALQVQAMTRCTEAPLAAMRAAGEAELARRSA